MGSMFLILQNIENSQNEAPTQAAETHQMPRRFATKYRKGRHGRIACEINWSRNKTMRKFDAETDGRAPVQAVDGLPIL